ncbi:MAG: hypothetical protein M1128_01550 [Candidatus Marsarchaeota archaeon]|nr:hypothetical protein [Candidatus Marsarchaeota archaeon]
MEKQFENKETPYSAKAFANSYTRVKYVFGNPIMLSYADAASSFCCNPEVKTDTLYCMIPNSKMIEVDTQRANLMGFYVEDVRSRFIEFYDTINAITIKIGLKHEKYSIVNESLKEIIGENEIINNHSFLGVSTDELLFYSKLITVDHSKVLVPSYIHQLAMLYSLWLSETDDEHTNKYTNIIKPILLHHFRNPEKLWHLSHDAMSTESPRYVNSMCVDLERMLRK